MHVNFIGGRDSCKATPLLWPCGNAPLISLFSKTSKEEFGFTSIAN